MRQLFLRSFPDGELQGSDQMLKRLRRARTQAHLGRGAGPACASGPGAAGGSSRDVVATGSGPRWAQLLAGSRLQPASSQGWLSPAPTLHHFARPEQIYLGGASSDPEQCSIPQPTWEPAHPSRIAWVGLSTVLVGGNNRRSALAQRTAWIQAQQSRSQPPLRRKLASTRQTDTGALGRAYGNWTARQCGAKDGLHFV